MFALLHRAKRHPDRKSFRKHWHQQHGPIISGTPALRKHIAFYEQHPALDEADMAAIDGPFDREIDGYAFQQFGSMDSFFNLATEPMYREVLAPDEKKLLNMDRLEFILCEENQDVFGVTSGPIKVTGLLRPAEGLEAAEFFDRWTSIHAELVREHAGPKLLGYRQWLRSDSDNLTDKKYQGVAEQWFESIDALQAFRGSDGYQQHIAADAQTLLSRESKIIITQTPIGVIAS